MFYDPLLVIAAITLAALLRKNTATFIVALAYLCNYLFLESDYFGELEGGYLYLICAAINVFFLFMIWALNTNNAIFPAVALLIYAITNLIYFVEYNLYPYSDTILSSELNY